MPTAIRTTLMQVADTDGDLIALDRFDGDGPARFYVTLSSRGSSIIPTQAQSVKVEPKELVELGKHLLAQGRRELKQELVAGVSETTLMITDEDGDILTCEVYTPGADPEYHDVLLAGVSADRSRVIPVAMDQSALMEIGQYFVTTGDGARGLEGLPFRYNPVCETEGCCGEEICGVCTCCTRGHCSYELIVEGPVSVTVTPPPAP